MVKSLAISGSLVFSFFSSLYRILSLPFLCLYFAFPLIPSLPHLCLLYILYTVFVSVKSFPCISYQHIFETLYGNSLIYRHWLHFLGRYLKSFNTLFDSSSAIPFPIYLLCLLSLISVSSSLPYSNVGVLTSVLRGDPVAKSFLLSF